MSRSNPTENINPNPAARFLEWGGSEGVLKFYDKEKKAEVNAGDNLVFILLDQLSCVKGWHDASESGIYSNEVKDTRRDVLLVKAFKGGVLANGLYAQIKDRVASHGGHYVASCYIAVKHDGTLRIEALQLKGAALREWMEFAKKHRADLYKKAIRIKGFKEDKKGKVTYRTPVFSLLEVTPETDAEALALDKRLQEYLASYLNRPKVDAQAEASAPEDDTDYSQEHRETPPPIEPADQDGFGGEADDDSIPF
jgi:hypothetical protein